MALAETITATTAPVRAPTVVAISRNMPTPNAAVKSGTMTTPPPRPVSAPRKPATSPPSHTKSVNSRTFIINPSGQYIHPGCDSRQLAPCPEPPAVAQSCHYRPDLTGGFPVSAVARFRLLLLALIILAVPFSPAAAADNARVYVVLWFDTEDYLLPAS